MTTKEPEKESNGFFGRLKAGLDKTRSALTDKIDQVFSSMGKIDEDLFEELEEVLIMSDVGTETASYIIEQLQKKAKESGIRETDALKALLRDIITEILAEQDAEVHLEGAPAVVMVIGVNGVGKTTSIGKLAHYYKEQGKRVILAAGDTFRAAAIDQLAIWAERAGVELVKHQEGADPSAVVFDSIQAAKARGADLVICDTAGRLHNKKNLMEELKKTARVVERETGGNQVETLLVLDASTGQNALNQAREFAQAAGITGVVLTKLDGTAKGGVILALAREQGVGVKFIGVGEGIDDLRPFDAKTFAQALFTETDN
ncbi:MAG: signal recognition particle-docking protein FtsY [Clostridia bacterium]|nr:signal recognition particle-docking protein FtsY [Clostridia bacterium]